MAGTPAEGPGHRPGQSPSPEDRATASRAVVALTTSAMRYAGKRAIVDALGSLGLGAGCVVGDMVSLLKDGERHDFSIIRRRWIADAGGITLEVTLDHPAR